MNNSTKKIVVFLVSAVLLLALPLVLRTQGNAWVRIVDIALLYVLLTGCSFHPRCPLATDACRTIEPPLLPGAENHDAACLLVPGYAVPSERSRR